LALVMGGLMGGKVANELPAHTYRNESQLDEASVAKVINQSRVGIILSESEGACFASSEYLLCGLPVVSTYSKGGRDVWYNEINSIQVGADSIEVAKAVKHFVDNPVDPSLIRNLHIQESLRQQSLYIKKLTTLFADHSVPIDAEKFFKESYIHKLRNSESPNFINIWP